MNDKYRYLGKNTLLFTISSFGTKLLSFFLVPLYTNVLSTAEYGIADLITTTGTLLVFILTINISDSVLRFVLEAHGKRTGAGFGEQDILSFGNRVILLGTLLCTLGVGVVFYLRLLDWPAFYFVFIVLYFYATAFYQMMSNYLRAVDKVASVAVAGLISGIVSIVCNILFLVVIKLGVIGYLLAMVIGPLAAAAYCAVVAGASAKTYFVDSCSKVLRAEMRKYCIPLIFNNVALWANAFIDRYFVTAICGVDANGIYSVATKIPVILATCYTVFGQAWNLSAIKEFDPEDSDGFFTSTYSVVNGLMCLLCSTLILLNIPLAYLLYAKDFFEAWRYSSVLLIYVLFDSLAMLLAGVFSAVKDTRIVAFSTVISAVCNICLNAAIIPRIGVMGAAVATGVAYFIMWVIRFVTVGRYIRLNLINLSSFAVYGLLILQVVFEHMVGHFYLGQTICFVAIFVINRHYVSALFKLGKNILSRVKTEWLK